ncbi:MAG TPA: response regulator transcription factor [Devosia sp.]|nr:response regulator transcription factor [Devosia sp.]
MHSDSGYPDPARQRERKILVAEDDDNIRNLLASYLSVSGFATVPVATGSAAIRSLERERFDLAVLDIMLPDVNGLDICTRVREHHNMPILMLTALGEERDRIRGFEVGADDYLVKPFSPRELVARVKAILRRTAPGEGDARLPAGDAPPGSTPYPIRVDAECKSVHYLDRELELTRYEFKILSALVRRPGVVFSRDELLDLLYPTGVSVVPKAVDVHIHNLRTKLGKEGAKLIQTVRSFGYRAAKVDPSTVPSEHILPGTRND